MNLSIIAAVGKNNELGKNNDLIWHFRDDMRFFKEKTMGHHMIMGRKTFESLPRLLDGRKHLVLTRSALEFPEEVDTYKSVSEFLEAYRDFDGEVFDIGGASIYRELLEYASKLYLTEIDAECPDADVYFPDFDKNWYDREELTEYTDEKTGISYKHVLYKRKNYGKR